MSFLATIYTNAQTCSKDEDSYDNCLECCITEDELSKKEEFSKLTSEAMQKYCDSSKEPIAPNGNLKIPASSDMNEKLFAQYAARLSDYCSDLKKKPQNLSLETFNECKLNCKNRWPKDD